MAGLTFDKLESLPSDTVTGYRVRRRMVNGYLKAIGCVYKMTDGTWSAEPLVMSPMSPGCKNATTRAAAAYFINDMTDD